MIVICHLVGFRHDDMISPVYGTQLFWSCVPYTGYGKNINVKMSLLPIRGCSKRYSLIGNVRPVINCHC